MTIDFGPARENMVESQVRPNDVTDLAIQDAMRSIPREQFCGGKTHLAYADADVEYAPGRFLLKPRDVAKLLQAVQPRAGERALAIAAPYAGAVLEALGLSVTASEDGAGVQGTFDVIICEAAVAEAPSAWLQALARGGRLAVIQRRGPVGQAKIFLKSEDDIGGRAIFDATTAYLAGHEPRQVFAL